MEACSMLFYRIALVGVIWPTTQVAANLKISQAWLTDDDHHHNSIIALKQKYMTNVQLRPV